MRYQTDKNKNTPVYIQLYQQIKEDIIGGIYPYQSKLPSKRIVSAELQISIISVEHAYELLCDEGYIEARERSGYFVIFKEEDGFVHTSISLPNPSVFAKDDSQLPISVFEKAIRYVMREYGSTVLNERSTLGSYPFREAIRQYLVRGRGIDVDVDQIVVGSGSEQLYGRIAELLGRDKIFAIEDPSYKKIEQVYQALHCVYLKLPLMELGIESGALWECKADILHVTPYRSYPSGVSTVASKRYEYLRWAEKGQRYIIEDDFESEFTVSMKMGETLFSCTKKENVIYMNSFSKTIFPSIRVAYMVLPKHLAQIYQEKLGFYSCTVPALIQYTLAVLLSNGDFERHINRIRRKKRKEMDLK